ncbi:MAG: glycosyltransferase family 39 protein [Ktedonobacteraceae bacterium]|nr:glycosyltransferase family 39 protein [Ktedonobacteraceae bacterium]
MKPGASHTIIERSSRHEAPAGWHGRVQVWLGYPEVYFIACVAAFLRLYGIHTTEFDGDQATIFRIAYDAVHHGMLAATANGASLPILNPPAIIYFLMIPAAFSANPVWAAGMTALLAVLAVLLTYIITCRYAGRLAGTVAASLYATATYPIFYSRFTWNQNLLPLFVVLFMLALLWGVVEKRKGWLFPALLLVGLLYQLHGSGVMLIPALLIAVLLAPETVRFRDLIAGVVSLALLYAPYLLWEISSNFHDLTVLLGTSNQTAQVDAQALLFYQQFLSPYNDLFAKIHSILLPAANVFITAGMLVTILATAAGVTALASVVRKGEQTSEPAQQQKADGRQRRFWSSLRTWWRMVRADPGRSGLLVLLAWQIIPLLALSRHTITLHPHYLIILMPGPFILIGIVLAKCTSWIRRRQSVRVAGPLVIAALLIFLITAQLVASTAVVFGLSQGAFRAADLSRPYYNDLDSLQRALARSDALAQQHQLKHIYIAADAAMKTALQYLAEHIQTPTTVFDDSCLVLPATTSGPSLLLLGPYSDLTATLAAQSGQASVVEQIRRLSGPPFKIYAIKGGIADQKAQTTFPGELRFLGAQRITFNNMPQAITKWTILRSEPVHARTTYMYTFRVLSEAGKSSKDIVRQCSLTSLQPGDQLLVAFPLADQHQTTLNVQAQYSTDAPLTLKTVAGLTLATGASENAPAITLQTQDSRSTLTVALPT